MRLGRAFKALQIWAHSGCSNHRPPPAPLQALAAPIRGVSMPFSTRSRFILLGAITPASCTPHLSTPHLSTPFHPLGRNARPVLPPVLGASPALPRLPGPAQVAACRGPWQPRPLLALHRSAWCLCGPNMEVLLQPPAFALRASRTPACKRYTLALTVSTVASSIKSAAPL